MPLANSRMTKQAFWIGVMSGSSLDGVDVALLTLDDDVCEVVATHFQAYPENLKTTLLGLHSPVDNELENAAVVSNTLAYHYAEAIHALLQRENVSTSNVLAIGCHGQTIRHQPKLSKQPGYSIQLGNHALLAELTNTTVVGDFRSRDIAAGGQGAPLVPAFHQALFSSNDDNRAIVNIGGIANISYLKKNGNVIGFDTGPGNVLIDYWTQLKTEQAYDKNGEWAASGKPIQNLLASMLSAPYFTETPPKSTGRDLFNKDWLSKHMLSLDDDPQDIARTLVELTTETIYDGITQHCHDVDAVYICGGGAHNQLLMSRLKTRLGKIPLDTTAALGVGVDWVEAVAFGWLAKQAIALKPANLPAATGAKGPRILGAIYPN